MIEGHERRRERLARVALNRIAEPGDLRMAAVVAELGAIDALAWASRPGPSAESDDPSASTDVRGSVRADVAERLRRLDPAGELADAERRGLRFVVPGDAEWPLSVDDLQHGPRLVERGGVPIGLWVRGPVRLDALAESVAVVGARTATTYGTEVARELAADVARGGWAVVSGAAFGIDQAAHRGALAASGVTVAVLACGADRAYPAAHEPLLEHLARHGAVVSEAPPGAAPMRVRFLARNRLIAALTRGTVVVEAAPRSGALNTANWADGLSRVVMGVPGPVTAVTSAGVHALLRRGGAVVTSGAEVLESVGDAGTHLAVEPRGAEQPRDALTPRQRQVLDGVPVARPAPTTAVARTAGVGAAETERTLDELLARGLVDAADGGWRLAEPARPTLGA
ncbi:MAG TPA: DNA-processing protein DprA [Nocardioides sp.]|uniref:DNA-processing protein DprA n=1 Tax=Nocardioides sp. TaxID=35761 RepID=UPI002ED8A429